MVLDCESANASPLVLGPNAAARPAMELALRKRRRNLSSGGFIMSSFEFCPFPTEGVLWSHWPAGILRFWQNEGPAPNRMLGISLRYSFFRLNPGKRGNTGSTLG